MNKEFLEKQSIHYLRTYARQIGVKKSTTYRKFDLIEQILNVLEGKIKPHFSCAGRPPLNYNEIEEYVKELDLVLQKFRQELILFLINNAINKNTKK